MIVHLLRSPEYPKTEFNSIFKLLNIKSKYIKLKNHSNDFIEYETQDEIKDWNEFFNVCRNWRLKNKISGDDYVFLLTKYANNEDFFSWTDEKLGDYFIHAPELEKYFYDPKNQHFATVYEIYTCILISLMYDTREEILEAAHKKARGCPLDYCDDKEEIVLKIRTGDLCYDCLKRIKERGINPLFLGVIFNKLEEIRKGLIFRERTDIIEFESPLKIVYGVENCKIEFEELDDVKINFDDLQTSLYCLLLRHKFIEVKGFEKYSNELKEIYYNIKNGNINSKEAERSVKTWTNPENSEIITQNVSKINSKLIKLLGQNLASNYLIQNLKGKYSIKLDRKLFREFTLNLKK
jgi:hypothetical protein